MTHISCEYFIPKRDTAAVCRESKCRSRNKTLRLWDGTRRCESFSASFENRENVVSQSPPPAPPRWNLRRSRRDSTRPLVRNVSNYLHCVRVEVELSNRPE